MTAYIVKPRGFDASQRYPVLLTQYSGDQDYQALSGAEWSAEDYPACGEKN